MGFELPPNLSLEEAVFQSLGAASTCWEDLHEAGICEVLVQWIKSNHHCSHGAQLGLATTKQLLDELATRMRHTQNSTAGRLLGERCLDAIENLDDRVLGYRTVDSH